MLSCARPYYITYLHGGQRPWLMSTRPRRNVCWKKINSIKERPIEVHRKCNALQTYSNVSVVDIMKSFSAARHRSPFDPPIILSIGRSQLLYKSAVVYAFPKKAILILNKDFKSQRCGGKKRAPLTSWEMSWRTGRFFAVFWRDRHSNQNCLRVGRAGVSRRVRYLNSFYSATGQPAWESVIFSMTTTVSIHFFSFLIRRSGIWYLNSHKLLDF